MPCWFNGKEYSENIPLGFDSPLIQYGIGLFETMLSQNDKIYFVKEHLERHISAWESLAPGSLVKEKIEGIFKEGLSWVTSRIEKERIAIKVMSFPHPIDGVQGLITMRALKEPPEAITLKDENRVLDMPYRRLKSVHYFDLYMSGVLEKPDIDIVWKTKEGLIAEAGKGSLALVNQKNQLVVVNGPPILPGVTLKKILELGFFTDIIRVNGFSLNDMQLAREALYMNSLVGCIPVYAMDGHLLEQSGVSKRVREALFKLPSTKE